MQTPRTKPSKPIQISKNISTCFEPYDHALVAGTQVYACPHARANTLMHAHTHTRTYMHAHHDGLQVEWRYSSIIPQPPH
jgi:hypothetical protein